jgi:hypothetical protein
MFTHRGYNGWITDLSSVGRPNATWPAIDINAQLIADFQHTFAFMQQAGLNEMTVWGFFAAGDWEIDIAGTIDDERATLVRQLLEAAHAHGIKVLSGMGVYSWGFDKIIQHNPQLNRSNPHAMCASLEESWVWQQRVIDFVMSFPVDGVSMQSADQGRCTCDECRRWSDAEYHARINDRAAGYIKQHWPDRIVGLSNWGMDFQDPSDLPHLVSMTRHADYLIDVADTVIRRDAVYRRVVAQAIAPCALGSGGAPNIEPPQHWDRDRWFLPTLRHTAENLQRFYTDGGRAVENYMHILVNPGDEVSIRLAAAVELAPAADWRKLLEQVLANLYGPADEAALSDLMALFLDTEMAYVDNATRRPLSLIRVEPLVSSTVGPPIYIMEPVMNREQRERYAQELRRLQSLATKLATQVGDAERMRHIVHCIERVLADIDAVNAKRQEQDSAAP